MAFETKRRKAEEFQPNQDEEYEHMLENASQRLRKRRKTDESVKAYLEHHKLDETQAIRLGYKSRLCQFNEKGACHKGNLCQYAHGKNELIKMEAPKEAFVDTSTSSALPALVGSSGSNSIAGVSGGFAAPGMTTGATQHGLGHFSMTRTMQGIGTFGEGLAIGASIAPLQNICNAGGFARGPKSTRCALFPRGLCQMGDICPWAHYAEELLMGSTVGSSPANVTNISGSPIAVSSLAQLAASPLQSLQHLPVFAPNACMVGINAVLPGAPTMLLPQLSADAVSLLGAV